MALFLFAVMTHNENITKFLDIYCINAQKTSLLGMVLQLFNSTSQEVWDVFYNIMLFCAQ